MDYIPRRLLDTALHRLGREALRDRLHALRALGDVRGMRYLNDDGRPRTISMALKPWLLTSEQLWFFHRAMRQLVEALLVLPQLWAEQPEVRRIIQFTPERQEWLRLVRHPRSRPLAAIGRLDSTALYDHAAWRSAFRMLEPNAVGVGGVHYAPTGSGILMDVLGDVLTRVLPGRVITPAPDPRQLLLEELWDVARRLGRPLRGVALIENTDFTTGTDEFSHLAAHLKRCGLRAIVADPRELRLVRGQLTAKGEPVELLYRDSELAEFIQMESRGRRLTALRQAVREGRLISGLTWEFDQKSAWEIFTDSRFSRYFSAAQRAFFRRHVLWTRLVRQERVTDVSGRLVDLPSYIRRHRRALVLKPNTLFGGEGVVLGQTVSQREWERHLQRALRACLSPSGNGRQGRERYVVQQVAPIAHDRLPILEDGHVRFEERATVSGFFFSSRGIGVVGRFSAKPVVNVSQGGGLVAALWVH